MKEGEGVSQGKNMKDPWTWAIEWGLTMEVRGGLGREVKGGIIGTVTA